MCFLVLSRWLARAGEPCVIIAHPSFKDGIPRMESPFKGKTGLRRILNAFHYSLDGLSAAYRHEDAFRQEIWLTLVAIPLALWLGDSALERALMIGCILLVLIVELVNSAIEATVDRVSLERHQLAKRAKDIGSAAVLIALINAAVVWGLLLLG
jgi:diacylglycerol kinase (ATP)